MVKKQQTWGAGGFTLLETLAVVGVIGIIVAIALTAVSGLGSKTKDLHAKSDLRTLKNAIEHNRIMRGSYPPADSWGLQTSPLLGSVDERLINEFPEDPYNPGNTYAYLLRDVVGEKTTYIVWSRKEGVAAPIIYGDDRVYLNGVTLYITNASLVAADPSEIVCSIQTVTATPRGVAGSFLPFVMLLLFLLGRRSRNWLQPSG